ncbi:MAG: type II toxin-antitoxin system HicA family toxin [Candidatus Sumerlaeia bacterium]|nr:type II toxin-antitoxin system HicA family toxin [Candidatus Sumerlaeia bacterium]
MSPRFPRLSANELVRLLEAHGFVLDRQKGSHAVYIHPDGRRTTVPMHGGRTISIGLLRQIFKDTGIIPDER